MPRIKWKIVKIVIVILPLFGLLLTACTTQLQGNVTSRWESSVAKIEATLNQAIDAYEKGEKAQATQLAKERLF